jgi:hypothetical protein
MNCSKKVLILLEQVLEHNIPHNQPYFQWTLSTGSQSAAQAVHQNFKKSFWMLADWQTYYHHHHHL